MNRGLGEALFFVGCLFIVYTWLLYPLLLLVASKTWPTRINRIEITPTVSIVLCCLNEAGQLAGKIENILALEYPRGKLEIIVASDGSTDDTYAIAQSFAPRGITAFNFPGRQGRARVHNALMGSLKGDIVLFTDADTRFQPDMLRRIVRPLADPRVGCVLAEVDFVNRGQNPMTQHRGFYWRIEHFMRIAEGDLGILALGAGSCMAVRRSMLKPLAKPSYDVDFITPLDVVAQDALVIVEAGLVVTDLMLPTVQGEFTAEVRMVAKNFRGILERLLQINPFRHPGVTISLLSHKFFRWLTPFFMLLALVGNACLIQLKVFRALLVLQLAFYTFAILGAVARDRVSRHRWGVLFMIPFSFCLANLAFLWGVLRGLFGEPIAAYQNVK